MTASRRRDCRTVAFEKCPASGEKRFKCRAASKHFVVLTFDNSFAAFCDECLWLTHRTFIRLGPYRHREDLATVHMVMKA